MKVKRQTLLRIGFNYVSFIFLVCFINDAILFIFPLAEFHGLTNTQILKLLIDAGPSIVPFVYSAALSVICVYWMIKLRPAASVLSGIIVGVYFALLIYPHSKSLILEEMFLPEDLSVYMYFLYLFVLLLGVPIIVFMVTNRLVIFVKKIRGTRDSLVVTE